MSEGNESEIIDLGYGVTEDDVKKPLLPKGVYKGKCLRVWTEVTEASDGSGAKNKFMRVQWELSDKVKDIAGKEHEKFQPYPQRIMMNPSGKLTEEMIRQKVQQVHFALCGEGRVNTGPWVGKEAALTLSLREARTDEKTNKTYDASNEIDRVNPLKK